MLDSGADGRVFMASTVPTQTYGGTATAFVVKIYRNNDDNPARRECSNLTQVYVDSGLLGMGAFRVMVVGGDEVLAMPYFHSIPQGQRAEAVSYLETMVFPKFTEAGFRMNFADDEVHWRHILTYNDALARDCYIFVDLLRLIEGDGSRWEAEAAQKLRDRM